MLGAYGGWIHPNVGSSTSYNLSWPVAATANPTGLQLNVAGYTGYIGRTYDAAGEMDYFTSHFSRRSL